MRSRNPPLVGLRSTSSPTASTSPVNITLYQHIGTQRLDTTIVQSCRPEWAIEQQPHAVGAQDAWRHVQADEIDQPLVPRRRVNLGAPFEQQRFDPPRAQTFERRPERRSRNFNLGATVLE